MKKIQLTIFIVFIAILMGTSQETQYEKIDWLSDFETEITVGSSILVQKFEKNPKTDCLVKFTATETDKKGKTEILEYFFNFKDVNVDQIKYQVSGKNIEVSIPILKGNKFITLFKDGVQQSYDDEIILYFGKLDVARNASDALKANIPNCTTNRPTWSNAESCIKWLQENLKNVIIDGDDIFYEVSVDENKKQLISLSIITKDSKGTTETNTYKFNINDINETTAGLNIKGKSIEAELETNSNNRYIEVVTNEKKVNYDNDVAFPLENIELAKSTINAFNYLMQNSPEKEPSWPAIGDAISWITENVNKNAATISGLHQQIEFSEKGTGITTFTTKETDSKGIEIETVQSFYLSEIDLAAVKFNVSGNTIEFTLQTSNSGKLIEVMENGQQENYTNKIEIEIDDIEAAKKMVFAFKQILSALEPGLKSFDGKSKAMSWTNENIPDVTIGEKTIKQKIAFDEKENALTLFQDVVETDGEINYQYLVYLHDINRNEIVLDVSGNEMFIKISTNEKKNYIKVIKGGVQGNFESSMKIYMDDTRLARNIENALKLAVAEAGLYTPKATSMNEAVSTITSVITEVSDGSNVYQQEFKIMEEDKCKINVVSQATDSKGVTSETMYEFNMVDIAQNEIEYSVSRSIIKITLECNDRMKLIKPYVNNEEKNFMSSMEILINDVRQAKDLVAALQFYVAECKK